MNSDAASLIPQTNSFDPIGDATVLAHIRPEAAIFVGLVWFGYFVAIMVGIKMDARDQARVQMMKKNMGQMVSSSSFHLPFSFKEREDENVVVEKSAILLSSFGMP